MLRLDILSCGIELVNHINRGGADKKGESSSRGPQQPSDVQIKDSAENIYQSSSGISAVGVFVGNQQMTIQQKHSLEKSAEALFQQMFSLREESAGYSAFSRKLKLSAVVKRSARDKATTYRKKKSSRKLLFSRWFCAKNQQVACTSRRNQQYIQTRATVDQLLICIQSQDDVPVASFVYPVASTSRSTSGQPVAALKRKTRCEVVAKGKEIISVDWIAMERKPDARYPVTVFEVSAVAQRIQRSRWKNQWLRLSRANCLELREQYLYYSGK
ncbi:hypothetical protein F511_35823 [Dorcoceras hygrometricum]|uniref:Uncharacterized protein n=1 Tax=Dorcoceras hygrometricum TaxID=472368 RepID=A0A2Z7D7J0_9LAMI|nr:hypothetical protein F511_35823 [Dorcoceras hygrometricum]